MITFRILFGIDALAAAVVGFFLMWGLSDGTVSSYNIQIWLVLIGGTWGIVAVGLGLRLADYRSLAIAVLLLPAVPVVLYALFFLGLIIFQPRWN